MGIWSESRQTRMTAHSQRNKPECGRVWEEDRVGVRFRRER